MPREHAPYATLEPAFILSDWRYKSLPASAKVLYIALWCRAVMDRRVTLSNHYDTAAMQYDSSLDARTVRASVAILQQRCLISVLQNGNIRVNGISKKVRIKWKDDGVDISPKRGKKAALGIGRSKKRAGLTVEEGVSSTTSSVETKPAVIPDELRGLELYENDAVLCAHFERNIASWKKAYPLVDLREEIAKAHAWEVSNPSKRKKDRARFLNGWFGRATGKEPSQGEAKPQTMPRKLENPNQYIVKEKGETWFIDAEKGTRERIA